MLLKIKHFIGKHLGTLGAYTCLRNGCEVYHGTSPSQLFYFHDQKQRSPFYNEHLADIAER